MGFEVLHGDVLNLPLADAAFDSCVTDPPYELGFMGKAWDSSGIAYNVDCWREVLRVMKPGAHLLAFGGTRTYHRMAVAIEDAGFEIRDQLQWIYGSGFPKSLDISKAIDKEAGARREAVGINKDRQWRKPNGAASKHSVGFNSKETDYNVYAPATDEAKQWNGFGTALKPANEPICLARKPLEKGLTVAQNVLKYGTGALNIDGCRVLMSDTDQTYIQDRISGFNQTQSIGGNGKYGGGEVMDWAANYDATKGRWPANVIHDGSEEVLAEFNKFNSHGAGNKNLSACTITEDQIYSGGWKTETKNPDYYADTGSAARFFYCAKADKSDRGNSNHHPTVKPTDLMQYLCRLITPPGGLILDPFCGSGSTIKAALIERFRCIGIDINAEYLLIAKGRMNRLQVKLF